MHNISSEDVLRNFVPYRFSSFLCKLSSLTVGVWKYNYDIAVDSLVSPVNSTVGFCCMTCALIRSCMGLTLSGSLFFV